MATRLNQDEWRQIVEEANASSLSKREWCEQAGISEKQFYNWQRKIRKIDRQITAENDAAEPVQEESAFVELNLKPPLDNAQSADTKPLEPEAAQVEADLSLAVPVEISSTNEANEADALEVETVSGNEAAETALPSTDPDPAPLIPAWPKPPISSALPFVAEMAIQTGNVQLLIGGNISEKALRTAMKVLTSA